MSTGEAAGLAAAMAIREQVTPAALDADRLVRALAESQQMVTFFNDVAIGSDEPWIAAVQYYGTQGFFSRYDAAPRSPLTAELAALWIEAEVARRARKHDTGELARRTFAIEPRVETKGITAAEFIALAAKFGLTTHASGKPSTFAAIFEAAGISGDAPISRGQACQDLYSSVAKPAEAK